MSRKKNILIMIVALSFSAFGVLFAYHYINNQVKSQTQQEQKPEAPVTLAKLIGIPQALKTGEFIEASAIAPMTVPEAIAFTADYVTWENREQILGKKLALDLPASAAIRYSDVMDSTLKVFADLLKAGERAMTIPVNTLNSIYGYLQPMDYIDLLLLENKSKKALPLLNKIQVLATDIRLEPDFQQSDIPNTGPVSTLTLKVNHAQAQQLAQALTKGEIVILLRNAKDTLAIPKISVNPKPYKVPRKVEIIIGGQS